MNLILLSETDFTDNSHQKVLIKGRRKEHVMEVFRAVPGDQLKVGLINGLLGTGTVESIDNDKIELTVSLTDPPPPPLPLTLVMALPRPKSLKKSIEVATALGIKKIYIIESWRVEKSYWSSPLLKDANLQAHLMLGLEGAKDTIVPKIEIRNRFKPFVEDELPDISKGTMALVAHPYCQQLCPHAVNRPVTLVIGPEGGFIPFEVELLEKNGFQAVTLGQRILRVENAIPAIAGRLF